MKIKLLLAITALTITALIMSSCSEEDAAPTTDADLIAAIEQSTSKQSIAESELPPSASQSLDQQFTNQLVSEVKLAETLGYEVILREEHEALIGLSEYAYFALSGRPLIDGDQITDQVSDRPIDGHHDRYCFRFVLPLSVTTATGQVIEITSYAQLRRLVHTCYDRPADCFRFNFPIEIQYAPNGFLTLENKQQLRKVFARCDRGDRERPDVSDLN